MAGQKSEISFNEIAQEYTQARIEHESETLRTHDEFKGSIIDKIAKNEEAKENFVQFMNQCIDVLNKPDLSFSNLVSVFENYKKLQENLSHVSEQTGLETIGADDQIPLFISIIHSYVDDKSKLCEQLAKIQTVQYVDAPGSQQYILANLLCALQYLKHPVEDIESLKNITQTDNMSKADMRFLTGTINHKLKQYSEQYDRTSNYQDIEKLAQLADDKTRYLELMVEKKTIPWYRIVSQLRIRIKIFTVKNEIRRNFQNINITHKQHKSDQPKRPGSFFSLLSQKLNVRVHNKSSLKRPKKVTRNKKAKAPKITAQTSMFRQSKRLSEIQGDYNIDHNEMPTKDSENATMKK